jgi:hypothetical protein
MTMVVGDNYKFNVKLIKQGVIHQMADWIRGMR